MLPNLIIPGSQKSGTTSLCDYLGTHPDCLIARPKEPHFFSRKSNMQNMGAYEKFFSHGFSRNFKIVADASVEYMVTPEVPVRLYEKLGADLKFVFMIRDPAKRAFSGYTHVAKRGYERRPPEVFFSDMPDEYFNVCSEEMRRIRYAAARGQIITERYRRKYDDEFWNFRYIANSFYSTDIQRYASIFGHDSILVLVFEEFLQAPELARIRLADFLGIDIAGLPDALPHSNPTRVQDVSPVGYALRSMIGKVVPSMLPRAAPVDHSTLRLKPTPDIRDSLNRVFASERDYWSDYFGCDMREFGWS